MKTDKSNGLRFRRYRNPAALAVIVACLAFGMGTHVRGQEEESANATAGPGRNLDKELALKITAPFTLAAVGDIIMPQPLTIQDPAYLQLINLIRGADVGFANMESSLVDISHFPGPIAGTEAPMETGQVIKDMGIKIMNHANNHTFDGGVNGMFSTDEALDKLGIVHAGTGKDLNQAREAKYLETPKGRVGVVGMFSIDNIGGYGPNFQYATATYRTGDQGGAPGMNPLHLTDYHIVTPEQFKSLRALEDGMGLGGAAGAADTDQLQFFDDRFRPGPNPGTISFTMNGNDERDILRSIREGKLYSDFMIATIHAHQVNSFAASHTGGVEHTTPDFLIKLAHDCIDNGADIFITHGMHGLRGVEIYKGKPIFYGIASFVFQFTLQYGNAGAGGTAVVSKKALESMANEKGPTSFENPENMETVLVTSHYEGGRLTEVRIYPVDLGGSRRYIDKVGIPMTPSPEEARRILGEMQTWSQPFGTTIAIENNVGVIRVGTNTLGAAKGQ